VGLGVLRFFRLGAGVLAATAGMAAAQWPQGKGVTSGGWIIHPIVQLSSFYDTNPQEYSKTNATGGFAYGFKPAINLTRIGPEWVLNGRFGFNTEQYTSQLQDDRSGFEEEIAATIGAPDRLAVLLSEAYRQVFEQDYLTGDSQDRHELDLRAGIQGKLTDKARIHGDITYHDAQYVATNLYGWNDCSSSWTLGHRLTDKTELLVEAGAGVQSSRDNRGGLASFFDGRAGFGSKATDKLRWDATFGAEHYIPVDGSNASTRFVYKLSGNWMATEKFTVSLSGDSGVQPGIDVANNVDFIYTFTAGVDYRILRRWGVQVQGIYRLDDYQQSVLVEGIEERRRDRNVAARMRLTYSPVRYGNLFAEMEYADNASSVDDYSYNRMRASLGITLFY